jgi:hypothetical protein
MNEWYEDGIAKGSRDGMWTMWWIKYAEDHKLLNLFGNPGGRLAWGMNWMEPGQHFTGDAASTKSDSIAVPVPRLEQLIFPEQPLVIDWNGETMKDAARFGASRTLLQDGVRAVQCALHSATRGLQAGQLPVMVVVHGGEVGSAVSLLDAPALGVPGVAGRIVMVLEKVEDLQHLRLRYSSCEVAFIGRNPGGGGSREDRVKWLSLVAAAGQRFGVLDSVAGSGTVSSVQVLLGGGAVPHVVAGASGASDLPAEGVGFVLGGGVKAAGQ